MRHSVVKFRSHRLPVAGRSSERSIRTSDLILAVTGVTLLGAYCLMMLAGIVGSGEGISVVPVLTGNS